MTRAAAPALALSAALLLAGCSSGGGGSDAALPAGPSTAVLRARAALEPCPTLPSAQRARSAAGLPDVTLGCLGNGPSVRLSTLTGVPAVVNLWAAWCAPCRQEVPALQRRQTAAAGRVRVLGVVTEDTARDALDAAAHLGMHYPSVVDASGAVKDRTGVTALPLTFFVDASGRAHRYVGPALTYDRLRELVAQYFGVRV